VKLKYIYFALDIQFDILCSQLHNKGGAGNNFQYCKEVGPRQKLFVSAKACCNYLVIEKHLK
jgi:hypothetical protein